LVRTYAYTIRVKQGWLFVVISRYLLTRVTSSHSIRIKRSLSLSSARAAVKIKYIVARRWRFFHARIAGDVPRRTKEKERDAIAV
jgi:hypothetical protein